MEINQKISVAVVGVGHWGPNFIRNLLEIERVEKIFIYDTDPKKLLLFKKKYSQLEIVESLECILLNTEIFAIFVITPVNHHFNVAEKALLAGKNVFIEKPLAQNSAECKILIEIAKQKKLALMVGHILEYKPAIRKIKEIIKSGEIGEVLYADAVRLSLGLIRNDVNVFWDSAVHDIYVLNFIFGEYPKKVSAVGAKYPHYTKINFESVGFLTLDYGGRLAHIHTNWLSPLKYRKMMICGTKKMLAYDDVDLIEPLKIYDRGVGFVEKNDNLSYRMGDTIIPRVSNKEPLKLECEHFIDCVLNKQKPQSDGIIGLNAVQIIEAAEESIKNESKFVNINYAI